jgi:hypothetical protein
MGIRSSQSAGPLPFDAPFQDWTWEIVEQPAASNADPATTNRLALARVEIVIRHTSENLVRRLTQWLPASATLEEQAESAQSSEFDPFFDPFFDTSPSNPEAAP